MDRILDFARSSPEAGEAALHVLERIADGRMEGAGADLEVQAGLRDGDLRSPAFRSQWAREYALSLIGKMDMPLALAYLRNFKLSGAPKDGLMTIWWASQVALHEALLDRIPDEAAKVKFLEDALNEQRDPWSDGHVSGWALNKLCNRSSLESLGTIRTVLKRDSAHGERQIAFCEAQMEVVSRNPDRVRALGSLLSVSSGFADRELLTWAVNQLAIMRSPAADAELRRL